MSQFLVSARKYRPSKFNEVIGQNHVATTLKNALLNDQLAHAFLFCGPRGVGKTSCARILAKVLNCQDLQNQVDPCGKCSSCVAFNDNASFNIIELDAASNNSVEHIRNLIEQVRFQPQHGTHKVFIIDEVHMLSSQAFNAFLKTLEEPPPYAVFILATTEKHKILPTILSRCQIFDFKRIQVKEIIGQLKQIAENEKITYEEEALNIIAQKADGAMRDALSIFDKVVSSTDRNISYDEVIENLNILDYDYFFKFVDAFLTEDISQVMILFDEILSKGFDPELCLLGLSEHLRELLLAKNKATRILLNASEGLKERYFNQSDLASHSFIMSGLSILNQADIHFQRAKNKRLHAEIALSKITYLNSLVVPLKAPIKVESAAQGTKSSEAQPQASDTAAPKVMAKTTSAKAVVSVSKKLKRIGFSSEEEILKKIEQEDELKKVRPKSLNLELIEEVWKKHFDKIESPTTKSSLKLKAFEIADQQITINLPSPSALNALQAEGNLLTKLRDAFDIDGLRVEPVINNVMFPDYQKFVPKKILGPREKYEKLVKKNPNIALLKSAFDLKADV